MSIQSVSSLASSGGLAVLPDVGASQSRARAESASAPRVQVPRDAVQAASESTRQEEVKRAVESVNQVVQSRASSLQFSIEPDTQMRIVKLVDTETNEVLRQVPSEEVLAIAKAIDRLKGFLLREDA